MALLIEEAATSRSLRDFHQLPRAVYHSDPAWVAPLRSETERSLDPRRNPYFQDSLIRKFICYRDNLPVARAVVVINSRHWRAFATKAAFFGFFEALDDPQAVQELFLCLEEYSRDQGADTLEGPFNPHHYSELGIQASHFGLPATFFQPYNPAYYRRLLAVSGFRVAKVLHTRKNGSIRDYVSRRYGNRLKRWQGDGFRVRSFALKDMAGDLERIRQVNNDAFMGNWHFLPLSREESRFSAKHLRLVTEPELIQIVEYRGQAVGVLHCVLDINPLLRDLNGRIGPLKLIRFLLRKKGIDTLIVLSVGIRKDFQQTRASILLLDALCRLAQRFKVLETTWMSDENDLAVSVSRHLGLQADRRFEIYEKDLGFS
jgi:hypothetical protein